MFEDALAKALLGVVQPYGDESGVEGLQKSAAWAHSSFSETDDGRMIVSRPAWRVLPLPKS